MSVFLSCIHLVKARCEFQNIFKVQNLLQNAELGIHILLFEKQSRIDSSGIWGHSNPRRRDTTRHMMMGPFWALAKAILLKKTGIRLENQEKLENCKTQMAASRRCASDLKKITSIVHVYMDGRTLWPKSIGIQGKSTTAYSQAKLLVYARGWCERVSWIFLLFWYFWRVCKTVDEWRML